MDRHRSDGSNSLSTIVRSRWITVRSLNRGETDFEPWFLFASATFGIGCLVWLSLGLPWPQCWVRHVLGIPCPTCGSTRSALALLHGHLGQAFQFNPLMCAVYLGVLGFDLYAASVMVFRTKRLRFAPFPGRIQRLLAALLVMAVVSNWIYLLCTMR